MHEIDTFFSARYTNYRDGVLPLFTEFGGGKTRRKLVDCCFGMSYAWKKEILRFWFQFGLFCVLCDLDLDFCCTIMDTPLLVMAKVMDAVDSIRYEEMESACTLLLTQNSIFSD